MGKYEKKKEVHLYLEADDDFFNTKDEIETTFTGCVEELAEKYGKRDILRTTIPHFLSFEYGKRLFVHLKGEVHEIREGECEGTEKEIKISHNIEKLLLNGSFSYFSDWDDLIKS